MVSYIEFEMTQALGTYSHRYLATEDYLPDAREFAATEGIQLFHYRIEGNKEPFLEIDPGEIRDALIKVLNERYHPGAFPIGFFMARFVKCSGLSFTTTHPLCLVVLIHCLKGRVRKAFLCSAQLALSRFTCSLILKLSFYAAPHRMFDRMPT